MLSRQEWNLAMFWGFIAYWIVLRSPDFALRYYPLWWLLPHAGFYAYGPDHYEEYAARYAACAADQSDPFA